MVRRLAMIGLLVLSVAGCFPRGLFAPPPSNYEMWVKPGVDEVTIWKDLLECDYGHPFSGGAKIEGGGRTFEQTAASMICMERLGYGYNEGLRVGPVCRKNGWKASAACLSGTGIPVPDVQRRLSSGYCKKYPKSPACIP